jgi:hypothetical protein
MTFLFSDGCLTPERAEVERLQAAVRATSRRRSRTLDAFASASLKTRDAVSRLVEVTLSVGCSTDAASVFALIAAKSAVDAAMAERTKRLYAYHAAVHYHEDACNALAAIETPNAELQI